MAHTHRYATSLRWTGSTGEGYDRYPRAHALAAPPAAAGLELSSDPAFRGDSSRLNPEQLLVAAASSCQLLSFLAVAARARVDVVAYEDDAEGVMPEGDDPQRITRIVLRPRVVVRPGRQATQERVRRLLDLAHEQCYIANSLRSEIVLEPEIRVLEEAPA